MYPIFPYTTNFKNVIFFSILAKSIRYCVVSVGIIENKALFNPLLIRYKRC
jgi:hypothetical protein